MKLENSRLAAESQDEQKKREGRSPLAQSRPLLLFQIINKHPVTFILRQRIASPDHPPGNIFP
jgi:hypothetical protein